MTRSAIKSESRRAGFTVVELVIAVVASSLLLLGLSSALIVAVKSSDTALTPARARQAGITRLNDIHNDLQYAIAIPERTATAIAVTVPDRNDADTNPETIRYAWSGTDGDPLTRQYNAGAELTVAFDVHEFDVQYYQPVTAVELVTIRLQLTADSQAQVETAIPLLNRP